MSIHCSFQAIFAQCPVQAHGSEGQCSSSLCLPASAFLLSLKLSVPRLQRAYLPFQRQASNGFWSYLLPRQSWLLFGLGDIIPIAQSFQSDLKYLLYTCQSQKILDAMLNVTEALSMLHCVATPLLLALFCHEPCRPLHQLATDSTFSMVSPRTGEVAGAKRW